MKKQILFLIAVTFNLYCFSQISYEKGYFINNNNEKIDCFILNKDWEKNPTKFKYKRSKNDESEEITIKLVKEFGVYNFSKFVRATVNIDVSTNKIDELNSNRNPVFKEQELFLNVLIEGSASLYLYEGNGLKRYFYSKENTAIEQLIYKPYKTFDNRIQKNNHFRKQLWENLKCSTLKITEINNMNYFKNDLIDFFVEYNKCLKTNYTNYKAKQKKDLFNINLRPGLNFSSLDTKNSFVTERSTNFGSKLTFRFGIETEFILPFNKDKWSVIVEPTYQYFKKEKNSLTQKSIATYNSIELPIGIRHYFFLNEKSKLFINASLIVDVVLKDSKIQLDPGGTREFEDLNDIENFAFGIGYKANNKYGFEFRYHTSRDLLNQFAIWSSDYKTVSIIFSYSIL